MSETSAELAKSRLQNEELSRLLKETRSQLDAMIADQQQRSRSPPPVQRVSPPVHSLGDWQGLQEALREVTSTLKDFRQWLPTAVTQHHPPPPPPPPPFPHPSSTQLATQPPALFALDNQQKAAHLALSQLAAFQQHQQIPQPTAGGPCFLLPNPSQPPPPTVPPPGSPISSLSIFYYLLVLRKFRSFSVLIEKRLFRFFYLSYLQ